MTYPQRARLCAFLPNPSFVLFCATALSLTGLMGCGQAALVCTSGLVDCTPDLEDAFDDWTIEEHDQVDSQNLAVGSKMLLAVSVESFITKQLIPENLQMTADDSATVKIEVLGSTKGDVAACQPLATTLNASCKGKGALLIRLTPLAPGPNAIRFDADNTSDTEVWEFAAQEPHRTTYPSEVHGFVDSSFHVRGHLLSSGDVALSGAYAMQMEAPPDSGSTLSLSTRIDLGPMPHSLEVWPSIYPEHVIDVNAVDLTGIESLYLGRFEYAGDEGYAFGPELREPVEVFVERVTTVHVSPRTASGDGILGTAPEAMNVVVEGTPLDVQVYASEVRLTGVTPGDSTVTISLGDVTRQLQVTTQSD